MEFWPSLSSSTVSKRNQSKADKGKGKSKANTGETWSNYPIIDHGAQSAATLVKVGDELEWRNVHSPRRGSLVPQGQPSKVYPCTRPKEITNFNASLRQRAEQGAKFLRTYHPDVDVPFEIIQNTIQEDDEHKKPFSGFDPSAGNTLCTTYCSEGIKKRAVALAFPTGSLGNELNVSPATVRLNSLLFQPRTRPAWAFDTPIRQIASSSPAVNMEENTGNNLAIRTYGRVSIFNIRNQTMTLPESMKPPFALSEVMSMFPRDLDSSDGWMVDLCFCHLDSGSRGLFCVTKHGAGYQCSYAYEDERKVIMKIFDAPVEDDCYFWRILSDRTAYGGILASDRTVRKFDTRTFGTCVDLFDYGDGRHVITSICSSRVEHMFCISTTSQVIWIDERFPKQPLLGWRHHRAFDRSLSVQAIEFGDTSLTILGSSKNNHVSVISVGKLQDEPLQCQTPPRALPSHSTPSICEPPISGRTLIRHPGNPSGSFSLLELSSQGSIHHQEFRFVTGASTVPPGQEHVKGRFDYQWSKEVHELERREMDLKPDYGNLAAREKIEVDLSGLYEALFGEEAQKTRAEAEEASVEEVYETLENMPSFWKRSDTGEEHIRTLFDVAFGSGSEPPHPARADFLTGTVLDSARGYRARKQGRIPVEEVAKNAGWHADIRPILRKISPEVFKEPGANDGGGDAAEALEPYTVRRDEVVPAAIRRETEAREQLALDLVLSSDIFSPTPIKNPTAPTPSSGGVQEDTAFLTEETQKLSLSGKEPPDIKFGFLRPVMKDRPNRRSKNTEETPDEPDRYRCQAGEESAEPGEAAKLPLGVRLLLSEWTIGDDPYAYEYVDPYDLDASTSQPVQSQTGKTQAGRRRQQQQQDPSEDVDGDDGSARPMQGQAPPIIITAKSLKEKEMTKASAPAIPARSGIRVQTQTQAQYHLGAGASQPEAVPGSSQSDMMISNTQIVPGKFGARQTTPATRKPAKKRMGGF